MQMIDISAAINFRYLHNRSLVDVCVCLCICQWSSLNLLGCLRPCDVALMKWFGILQAFWSFPCDATQTTLILWSAATISPKPTEATNS